MLSKQYNQTRAELTPSFISICGIPVRSDVGIVRLQPRSL